MRRRLGHDRVAEVPTNAARKLERLRCPMRMTAGCVAFVAALLGLGFDASASDPCGIYARIDEVTVGPDQEKPDWVRIKGDFILVKTSRRQVGPVRGYMLFSIPKEKDGSTDPKKAELCRIEWADLRELVGKKKNYVAFGSAHSEIYHQFARGDRPDVRGEKEAPANPIPYPINHGLTVLRTDRAEESDALHDRNASDEFADRNPVLKLKKYLDDHPLSTR